MKIQGFSQPPLQSSGWYFSISRVCCQLKKWGDGTRSMLCKPRKSLEKIDAKKMLTCDPTSCRMLYMMNTTETKANGTTTIINARGKSIKVYADGTANCCDCGGDYHPDDMRDSMLCLVCYDDRHADDWTMEDC